MCLPCAICIDELKDPVSLPCGHIYCHGCILRTIRAVWHHSTTHACPTCRAPFIFSPIDASCAPLFLRPHILPSIRRVYLDCKTSLPPSSSSSASSSSPLASPTSEVGSPRGFGSDPPDCERERLRAEVSALQLGVGSWRRRAETHAAATLGLLSLIQSTREELNTARRQNAELADEVKSLKRKRAQYAQDMSERSPSFSGFKRLLEPDDDADSDWTYSSLASSSASVSPALATPGSNQARMFLGPVSSGSRPPNVQETDAPFTPAPSSPALKRRRTDQPNASSLQIAISGQRGLKVGYTQERHQSPIGACR